MSKKNRKFTPPPQAFARAAEINPKREEQQQQMIQNQIRQNLNQMSAQLYCAYSNPHAVDMTEVQQEDFSRRCMDAAMSFARAVLGIEVRREVRKPVTMIQEDEDTTARLYEEPKNAE